MEISTTTVGDLAWYSLRDICSVLGLKDAKQEKRLLDNEKLYHDGRWYVSGMGCLALVTWGKKPSAMEAQRLVNAEFLELSESGIDLVLGVLEGERPNRRRQRSSRTPWPDARLAALSFRFDDVFAADTREAWGAAYHELLKGLGFSGNRLNTYLEEHGYRTIKRMIIEDGHQAALSEILKDMIECACTGGEIKEAPRDRSSSRD